MEPIDAREHATELQEHTLRAPMDRLIRVSTYLTSLIALLSAFAGIMSSRCTTRGLVAKNDAIFKQETATNAWAYFQSRNIRLEISELGEKLVQTKNIKSSPFHKGESTYDQRVKRLADERDKTYNDAKQIEKDRDELNERSALYLECSRLFASALVLLQVALVMTPLTMLLRQKNILAMALSVGAVGCVYLAIAYGTYFRIH